MMVAKTSIGRAATPGGLGALAHLSSTPAAAVPIVGRVVVDVGGPPQAAALGDVDGDGRADLVVAIGGGPAGRGPGRVELRRADPDGHLGAPEVLAAGDGDEAVTGLALVDVDGDGDLDLITAASAAVACRLNDGTGTFGPASANAAAIAGWTVAPGDFDGDGHVDVALSSPFTLGAEVHFGDGSGAFADAALHLAERSFWHARAGDLDGDGRDDLAVALPREGEVVVLGGTADRSFAAPRRFPTGPQPIDAVIGDADGDGRPDVVTTHVLERVASVLVGRGDGTLAPAVRLGARQGAAARRSGVAIRDVDADGRPDVLVRHAGGRVGRWSTAGDGTWARHADVGAAVDPGPLLVGDVDGDGRPDLAAPDADRHLCSILRNPGDGRGEARFASDRRLRTPGCCLQRLLVADLAGADALDVVVSNDFDSAVFVFVDPLVAAAAGTAESAEPPVRIDSVGGATALAAADLDGDGRRDLLVAGTRVDGLAWHRGIAPGGDDPAEAEPLAGLARLAAARMLESIGPVTHLVVKDRDGDGRDDVVLGGGAAGVLSVLRGADDPGSDEAPLELGPGPFRAMAGGDVDGDGRTDLVIAPRKGTDLAVLLAGGLEDDRERSYRTIPFGATIDDLALADLDGDGHLDIVGASSDAGGVGVRLGRGDGTFGPIAAFDAAPLAQALDAADLDGDGALDLVVACFGDTMRMSPVDAGRIAYLRGRGDGTFAAPVHVAAGDSPSDVVCRDLDGDGVPEVIVANYAGDVSVFRVNRRRD